MQVNECPKSLRHCPENECPMYPCWAYDKHLDKLDVEKQQRDEGWE